MENQSIMENQFIKEQKKLLSKIQLSNQVDISNLHYVAGVDLAYWKENHNEYAVCCIVVINFLTKEVVEKKYYKGEIKVPYIPGCLTFREIQMVLKTVELLEHDIELYVFDGNGYLHPRHMGLATHAGILLDKPSIGIAKSYFKIANTDYIAPDNEEFAYQDIVICNEVYGRAVRTHRNVKPIFLSAGHKIDIETAMDIVKVLVTKDSHIPIPTRYADIMTHEMRKKYQKIEYVKNGKRNPYNRQHRNAKIHVTCSFNYCCDNRNHMDVNALFTAPISLPQNSTSQNTMQILQYLSKGY